MFIFLDGEIIYALTLKEHPTVNLAFPPVGLHKMVLHLQKTKKEKFKIKDKLC